MPVRTTIQGSEDTNPCTGKWKLAPTPIDYEHSSVRIYISSRHAAYKVTNVDEMLKTTLNKSAKTTANAQSKEWVSALKKKTLQ
jgi:hypothetical protein